MLCGTLAIALGGSFVSRLSAGWREVELLGLVVVPNLASVFGIAASGATILNQRLEISATQGDWKFTVTFQIDVATIMFAII